MSRIEKATCPNCGAEISAAARNCYRCGNKMPGKKPEKKEEPAQVIYQPPTASRRMSLGKLAIVIVMIGFAFCGFLVIMGTVRHYKFKKANEKLKRIGIEMKEMPATDSTWIIHPSDLKSNYSSRDSMLIDYAKLIVNNMSQAKMTYDDSKSAVKYCAGRQQYYVRVNVGITKSHIVKFKQTGDDAKDYRSYKIELSGYDITDEWDDC